uniref:F-box domain-containing protein n=1 Tax=Brassica campestris TaxID=3711 RepID=M4E5S0_BRACM
MISDEVEPTKKKKKTVPDELPSMFSSLPDEIIENILARVSRWKYPSLSLVSKRFHSLLSSMDIYKARSQRGSNETCLYIWLKLPGHPCASWFSLRTKPNNQNRTKRRKGKISFKRDSSVMSVVPIPSYSSTDSNFPELSYIKTVGPEIYIIGGSYNKEPSSSVRIFDCRNHTWRDAPNMTVARENAQTVLLDEKIYVMGGCDIDKYYANWIEIFDVKTQAWTALPGPGADDEDELPNHLRKNNSKCYIVNVFKGKFYLAEDEKEYTYEPKNGTWKLLKENSSFVSGPVQIWGKIGGDIICGCTGSGHLMWSGFENEGIEWSGIKGLEELREHPTRGLETGSKFGLVAWPVVANF